MAEKHHQDIISDIEQSLYNSFSCSPSISEFFSLRRKRIKVSCALSSLVLTFLIISLTMLLYRLLFSSDSHAEYISASQPTPENLGVVD